MTKQESIIDELNVRSRQDDISVIIRERVDFLKTYLKNSGCTSYVLGISGGVDSLAAGLLAQQAVDELRDEYYESKFFAVKLPYATQADAKFVKMALDTISPDVIDHCNIQSIVDEFERGCDDALTKHPESQRDFIRGNIKARTRMVVQYIIANAENGLVIGTDHSAEAVNGFFTKHGDGACDVIPLSGLVKRTVRAIAKHYGASPELYEKEATADLEDLKVNLPDEVALGVTYEDIDSFLMGHLVPKDVENKIIERYDSTEHKRSLPVSNEDLKDQPVVKARFILKNIPNDFKLLLDKIEEYAIANSLESEEVLTDFDVVSDILKDMDKDGTYSEDMEALWFWYYDHYVHVPVSFEMHNNRFGSMLFGNVIEMDNSAKMLKSLNGIQERMDEMYTDCNHDVSIQKPTLTFI